MKSLNLNPPGLAIFLVCLSCDSIPKEMTSQLSGPIDSTGRLVYIGPGETVRSRPFVVHEDGSDPQPLVEDGADYQDPTFSPDGRSVAIASNRSGQWNIHVLNVGTLGLGVVATSETIDFEPTFSPDGRKIAFQRQLTNDLDWEIFVMNIDGSGVRNLTESVGPDRRPAWSPDGSRIAYQAGERLDQEIWLMEPDGRNKLQLTPFRTGVSGAPSWSPDGSVIVFESSEHQGDVSPLAFVQYDMYLVNIDGSSLRRFSEFSNPTRSIRFPNWSPGGDKMAFELRDIGGAFGTRSTIWILDTLTGESTQIPTPGTAGSPAWSPLTSP